MRAVVVTPGKAGSGRLVDMPDPRPKDGEVLVQLRQVGLDGTDAEIFAGPVRRDPSCRRLPDHRP